MSSSGGRTVVRQAGPSRGISKPLRPEHFVDHRQEDPAGPADDPIGDRALNTEMRWEAMAGAGYLTPTDSSSATTRPPRFWTPRTGGCGWRERVWSGRSSWAMTSCCGYRA
jgi:hypothetical protein